MSRPARSLAAAGALAALCLAGCGDVERTFGLVHDAPDEFTVETRAPLSIPPDFQLRPPSPGATRPQEVSSDQAAEAAIAPDTALGATTPPGPTTAGQQALVSQAGAPAPADIRRRVDSEVALDHAPRTLADRLMFWQPSGPPGTVIDPGKESQRLRENAALGQPVTNGETPAVPDKPKSSFLGIF